MTLDELTRTGTDGALDIIQIIKTLGNEIAELTNKLEQANTKIKELEDTQCQCDVGETDLLGDK